jgi:hypothetical protein
MVPQPSSLSTFLLLPFSPLLLFLSHSLEYVIPTSYSLVLSCYLICVLFERILSVKHVCSCQVNIWLVKWGAEVQAGRASQPFFHHDQPPLPRLNSKTFSLACLARPLHRAYNFQIFCDSSMALKSHGRTLLTSRSGGVVSKQVIHMMSAPCRYMLKSYRELMSSNFQRNDYFHSLIL